MKVLLAEDNRFHATMCESMLRSWGYEVIVAQDGEEAWLQLQKAQEPLIAVLDWMMPRLDGIELCRRIRGTPDLPPVYVIMITVREGKESTIAALESGVDDYVRKPFDPDELRAHLRVAARVVELQAALASHISALRAALSDAQKMEAVGRLAGGVAHDFNNLLTIMAGASELLAAHPQCDPQQHELVKMIKDSTDRGAALTRQLLAFSRKQVLQPVVLNLNDLIQGIQKMLRRLIGEDIELATQLAPNLGLIKADPMQIEQVLINLIVNARDAMPRGGTITIATADESRTPTTGKRRFAAEPVPYVRLTVTDTGCGMDNETRSHIFEPFFTTKEVGKGTGLGLATVHGIVQQSEGFIEVESAPKQGSAFTIFLPRTDAPVTQSQPTEQGRDRAGKGETILLVEDDETVRQMLRDVLQVGGYRVLEATNGQSALDLSERHSDPIHLMLSDVVMPVMSGPQLAERLSVSRSSTKVLFISGYTNHSTWDCVTLDHRHQFLSKPFTPQALLHKVDELLNGCPVAC